MKNITNTFTEEVDKVKQSVTSTNIDFGESTISDATNSITKVKEDLEEATGPIKRQM